MVELIINTRMYAVFAINNFCIILQHYLYKLYPLKL